VLLYGKLPAPQSLPIKMQLTIRDGNRLVPLLEISANNTRCKRRSDLSIQDAGMRRNARASSPSALWRPKGQPGTLVIAFRIVRFGFGTSFAPLCNDFFGRFASIPSENGVP
jgi:hypothetical protein